MDAAFRTTIFDIAQDASQAATAHNESDVYFNRVVCISLLYKLCLLRSLHSICNVQHPIRNKNDTHNSHG